MGDLISRSALISRFKQLQGSDTLANMFVSDVIREVKNQPTAYNVDKVCEQLDEMSYVEERNPLDPFSSVETKVVELSDAKRIVTAGGVNE